MNYRLYPFLLYFRKTPVILMFMGAVASNLFAWSWITFHIPASTTQVFLHYTILFGVDQIGEWWQIYTTPVIGLSILLFNMIAGWAVYRHERFYSYILLMSSLIVNIFVAIFSVLLVFLNS